MVTVHRIQNAAQYRRLEESKQRWQQSGRNMVELPVYFGSRDVDPASIYDSDTGFAEEMKRSKSGKVKLSEGSLRDDSALTVIDQRSLPAWLLPSCCRHSRNPMLLLLC